MNQKISTAFGQLYQRLPLKKSPHIHCANALRLDWKTVLPPNQCSYVLGNPPLIGHQWRTAGQQQDMELIWGSSGRFGRLDYVTCWYGKAADYIHKTPIYCGFVSTNSISQGEQVSTLWRRFLSEAFRLILLTEHFLGLAKRAGKLMCML